MGPRQTYRVCGFQQIGTLSSAVGLTIPTRDANGNTCKPNAVLLNPTTQAVRFRDDGTNPTSAIGIRIPADGVPFYYDGDLTRIRFIETTASAVLNVAYYEDESL